MIIDLQEPPDEVVQKKEAKNCEGVRGVSLW